MITKDTKHLISQKFKLLLSHIYIRQLRATAQGVTTYQDDDSSKNIDFKNVLRLTVSK